MLARQEISERAMTTFRLHTLHAALCASLLVIALSACPSDDSGDDEGGSDKGGAGASGGSDDKYACINATVGGVPSPLCDDCTCQKCPELAVECDGACWDLIKCMHAMCDANEANLDSCAAGACSAHATGLSAAKAFAPCAYRSGDRGQSRENRTSCLISCNFGTPPGGS
jgi:hypothetical protein